MNTSHQIHQAIIHVSAEKDASLRQNNPYIMLLSHRETNELFVLEKIRFQEKMVAPAEGASKMYYVIEGNLTFRRASASTEPTSYATLPGDILHVPAQDISIFETEPGAAGCLLVLHISSDTAPFHHIRAGEGKSLKVFTDIGTVKLGATDTNHSYLLMEWHVPPQGGPAMHTQKGQETFVILEGAFAFRGRRNGVDYSLTAVQGDVVHVPDRVAHTYQNISECPGRMLVLMAPAGHSQEFFEEIGLLVTDNSTFSPPAMPDPAVFLTLLQKYDVGIVV